MKLSHLVLLFFVSFAASCAQITQPSADESVAVSINKNNLVIEFDHHLQSRVSFVLGGKKTVFGPFAASEYVESTDGQIISQFKFVSESRSKLNTSMGEGQLVELVGISADGLQKRVQISIYNNFQSTAFYRVSYTNTSKQALSLRKWVNNQYKMRKQVGDYGSHPDFWSFQGASFSDRRDWIAPINEGFNQQNYMGMNASDYGSGTAVIDVWRDDAGIAVGHVETTPKLVSLPISYASVEQGASLHIEFEKVQTLPPNESFSTFETFVSVHENDYYASLKNYRNVMAAKGLKIDDAPDSAYEAIWCAWGYERDFTVDQVLASLPKAKELGLKWAVLDDGWQTSEGDWYLHPQKFPNGDKDMQKFVADINAAGLEAKLWWAPLAVDPGTDLLHEHSDMLLLDENGAAVDVTWWNSFYLCPAYAKTIDNAKELVSKMFKTWGYAGLKIDGQHLNGVPPCYNPAHNHASPEESVEGLANFWKEVYDTAISHRSDAVVEICPCGTSYAFHNIPYMNQTVSSDPLSSWQVRHKGKTLKALMGDSSPYYGDHVELSDNQNDFASSVGIGAVVGTKFTVASANAPSTQYDLDDQKEASWMHWIKLYNEKMLSKGVYLGELYDLGFDKPETHAISKEGNLYYGFYADSWNDSVEFRGLSDKTYQVTDYVNNKVLGVVKGPVAKMKVEFKQYLLLELSPVNEH